MFSQEDIQKVVQANREVFPTKEELSDFREEMRKSFSDLQTAVDAYAKKADAYFQTSAAISPHEV